MPFCIDLISFILLAIMVYQDFKSREITGFILPVLFLLFFVKSIQKTNFGEVLLSVGLNSLFLLTQLILVSVYFSIRQKRFFNILDTYLGKGDVFLLLAMTPLFITINYVLFYVVSLLISLVVFGIYLSLFRRKKYHIPLAGCIGIQLMICLLLQYSCPFINFRNDEFFRNALLQWMS